jgi:hypothetical protein
MNQDSRRAAERLEQAVEPLVADDLTTPDLPLSDRDIADALVRPLGVEMEDVCFDVVPQHALGEEDCVVETFLAGTADEALGDRIHIWGVDAGLHQLLAEHGPRLGSVLVVVVEDPMPSVCQRLAIAGRRAQDVRAPGVGRVGGDAEEIHASRVMFDGEEDEGIDHPAKQSDGDLDEVHADEKRRMAVPELRPGRPAAVVMIRGRTAVGGENTPHRGLDHLLVALDHLADDAREAGEPAVVDAEDSIDLVLADPGSLGRFPFPAIGGALLVALEPPDKAIGTDDPLEQFAERTDEQASELGALEPLSDGQTQAFATKMFLRRDQFGVNGLNEGVDGKAKGGAVRHPQADADIHRQGQDRWWYKWNRLRRSGWSAMRRRRLSRSSAITSIRCIRIPHE